MQRTHFRHVGVWAEPRKTYGVEIYGPGRAVPAGACGPQITRREAERIAGYGVIERAVARAGYVYHVIFVSSK